jgi:hypothetical protein
MNAQLSTVAASAEWRSIRPEQQLHSVRMSVTCHLARAGMESIALAGLWADVADLSPESHGGDALEAAPPCMRCHTGNSSYDHRGCDREPTPSCPCCDAPRKPANGCAGFVASCDCDDEYPTNIGERAEQIS